MVRSHLKLAQGSPYDPAKVDQSIKALFATGLFANVGIERRGATLVVKVVENPIVARVYVEGSTLTDKAKLDEQIHLKPRARYTAAKGHADALRLRDHYRRLGRLATAVEPSVVYQSDGRVEVAYVIKEGEVTKVDSIGFVGNRAFTEGQLRDVISTSQSGWFDVLKSAAFYDPERINQDKDLLRRHYLKQGFPDARVVSAEAVKNPRRHRLRHHLHRRGRRALHLRAAFHRDQPARSRHRAAAGPGGGQAGRHLQPGGDREIGREDDAGAERPGSGLRPGEGQPEARQRRPHHRHRLPRRGGAAHLSWSASTSSATRRPRTS